MRKIEIGGGKRGPEGLQRVSEAAGRPAAARAGGLAGWREQRELTGWREQRELTGWREGRRVGVEPASRRRPAGGSHGG